MALDARPPPSSFGSYVHERPMTVPPSVGHKRQRSGSNPLSWLKISSNTPPNNGPTSTAPARKISDPKSLFPLTEDVTSFGKAEFGQLGSGAQVVRTAAEARTRRATTMAKPKATSRPLVIAVEDSPLDPYDPEKSFLPSPGLGLLHSEPLTPPKERDIPLRPSRSAPPPPQPVPTTILPAPAPPQSTPPLRSALKSSPIIPFPPLPQRTEPSTPPPSSTFLAQSMPAQPFAPILLSSVPEAVIDRSQVLVSIDTTNATFKTTYATLTSRNSRLQAYLASLLSADDRSVPNSPMSFSTALHTHLTAQGLLSSSSTSISIFLDRPSGPYPHILSYLRSSNVTLPRAVQLQPNSTSRMEALLELRDEAKYLELDELYKLCCDELRPKQGHERSLSAGTARIRDTVRFASTASVTKHLDVDAAMSPVKAPSKEESFARVGMASNAIAFPRTSYAPGSGDWI